jgi:hypothetical protein
MKQRNTWCHSAARREAKQGGAGLQSSASDSAFTWVCSPEFLHGFRPVLAATWPAEVRILSEPSPQDSVRHSDGRIKRRGT